MKQGTTNMFSPITEREKWLTEQIMNIAITIHRALGPGLPENVYEKCFCHELQKRKISYVKQKYVPLVYGDITIEEGLRLDILIDDLIVIELKAQDISHPVWDAQLLSYLRLSGKRLGYILNFHVPLMKNGIKRMILN